MKLKYATVCSGIEAPSVAWSPLGWKPVWFSQYDPEHDYAKGQDFPSRVLAHRFPHVPNLGDMTLLNTNPIYNDSIFDVLCGGTPCQAFSIAGLRGGMDDQRGNLSLEFVRVLDRKRPTWFAWENVPGVLTSRSGQSKSDSADEQEDEEEATASSADFACLLGAFTGLDILDQQFTGSGILRGKFYSVAWRILDAQHFGVPQRRRRIFVVGHLGDDWRPSAAVLFEQDSLRRDFTPSRSKRKGTTENAQGSTGDDCRPIVIDRAAFNQGVNAQYMPKVEHSETMPKVEHSETMPKVEHSETMPTLVKQGTHSVSYRMVSFGEYADDGTSSALKKRDYKDATDLVCYLDSRRDSIREHVNVTPPILRFWGTGGCNVPFVIMPPPLILKIRGGKEGGGKGYLGSEQKAFSILTSQDQYLFVVDTTQITSPLNYSNPKPGDPCHPLAATAHPPLLINTQRMVIRRLTPTECARLQGFPDDWCKIEGASDSHEYQAYGNSMPVPVVRWIGQRIDKVHSIIHSLKP